MTQEAAAGGSREGREGRPRGLFLVFEGPEGAGKSTQVRLLEAWMRRNGIRALALREPGGTAVGEDIRRVVLEGHAMPARSELLLYLAARAALVEERIRPALAEGVVVLADRYTLSSVAYQGFGRGLPPERVAALNDFATGSLEPDLTLLLDIPHAEGSARREAAGRAADRIERAGDAFHRRVEEAYRLLAQGDARVARLDGTASPEAVHREVVAALRARFPETFAGAEG